MLSIYRAAAAREGWCITEVGMKDTPSYLVIRNVDVANEPSLLLIQDAAMLAGDEEAVESFRRSWEEGRDHALLAYNLIRFNSPAEFHFWSMAGWNREEMGV